MALRTRLHFVFKLSVISLALALAYGVSAYGGLYIATRAREVHAPDLRGLSPEEAVSRVTYDGLRVRIETTRKIHPAIESGLIAEQDPRAGRSLRLGRSVKVWLSSGPNTGRIPSMIGETETSATRRLDDDLFTIERTSIIRSSQYPAGVIVAQDPPPTGAGENVSLLINRGERGRTYVMPDLMGINGEAAAEILRGRGFRVTVVGNQLYPGISPGIVIQQAPGSGLQIAQGESISLEVSQ